MDNTNISQELLKDSSFKALMDFIEEIMAIPEENLNQITIDVVKKTISESISDEAREEMIKAVVQTFKESNASKETMKNALSESSLFLNQLVDELKPSDNKKEIFQEVFRIFDECFEKAKERYLNYDIILPIMLEEGAQMPTYAHDSDAAADLYAAEDVTLPPHSLSNMVKTNVRIELPDNWKATIVPRSSIGMKTGLRLSNSEGVIDSKVILCA